MCYNLFFSTFLCKKTITFTGIRNVFQGYFSMNSKDFYYCVDDQISKLFPCKIGECVSFIVSLNVVIVVDPAGLR